VIILDSFLSVCVPAQEGAVHSSAALADPMPLMEMFDRGVQLRMGQAGGQPRSPWFRMYGRSRLL
jgi:hypothetical protein